jgi:hypothetical protein
VAALLLALPLPQGAAAQDCAFCDEVAEGGQTYHHFHLFVICEPLDPDCYDCSSGAGCHEEWEGWDGTCDQNHTHCPSLSPELTSLALKAFEAQKLDVLGDLTRANPNVLVYNSAREALQILGCQGRVVGNLPVPKREWSALKNRATSP